MKKLTIEQRLENLEKRLDSCLGGSGTPIYSKVEKDTDPNGDQWVTIDYSVIPKETFDRYGAKPFQIMKRKMRKDGNVWNNISWNDAKKEANKLALRLPHITEILLLLDFYKKERGDKVSIYDKEFLGIEEISYDEGVCYELIDGPAVFLRGGGWAYGSSAGAFALSLSWVTGNTSSSVGFRCARDVEI